MDNFPGLIKSPKQVKEVKIGEDVYSEIPKEVLIYSKWATDLWTRLGKPTSPLGENGQKLMSVIIAGWEDLYPLEAKDWYADRQEYQNNELDVMTQIRKETGRSLASFPVPIFRMMRKFFPKFKLNKRENVVEIVKKFPVFRMARKAPGLKTL